LLIWNEYTIFAEKSYKGSFNLRLSPDLHRRAVAMAKSRGSTLNAFVKESIEHRLEHVF